MIRITLFFIGFLLLFTHPLVHAEVTLPRVIGNNMVLQRDMQVPDLGLGIRRRRDHRNP